MTASEIKRVTTRTLQTMKSRGQRISMLTAYDFPTAAVLDEAGIDILLVGDSLAMVVAGHETTLPVTMDQMLYHAEMVGRATQRAMVVVDLPFPEGQLSIEQTLQSASRVFKETRCHAVKLEGGAEQAARIEALVTAGIPVMAHVGLRPQNIHVDGGYRIGRDQQRLVDDALAAQKAGAFAVLIECVTDSIGKAITDALDVPTIGIGAGPSTDGQVLVTNDMVGLTSGYLPTFVRKYADLQDVLKNAAQQYRNDVTDNTFPGPDETFES
ncbi:3-methyl-2-oxobutanoate hydroxymethyltransferase [Crateriforma spongiae]|uniref:3-methyl-2-oxobutanoate hydroxymethyltransferase n=1 Tax=Crateriforma spongiae TaxID=2724528 RepID=UPI001444D2DF|nr:3-methyl-2-oxobutanoate hydroxymethyltransferase [Crateriforma spongiae]